MQGEKEGSEVECNQSQSDKHLTNPEQFESKMMPQARIQMEGAMRIPSREHLCLSPTDSKSF